MTARTIALILATGLLWACPGLAEESKPIVTSAEFNQSPDQLWPRIVEFLASRSVSPSKVDKTAGVIEASGIALGPNDLDCRNRHLLGDSAYKLSITLDRHDGKTLVIVLLNGSADLIRHRHFLMFRTSTVKTPVACFSTGSFEAALFERLR